ITCYICKESGIKLSEMRQHVGRHILQASRYCEDEPMIGLLPCGFCGCDSCHCMTQLQKGRRGTFKIMLTCPFKYKKMKYIEEKDSKASSPCSNVPIHCPLCEKSASGEPKTIWKYNTVYHVAHTH
ncbi:hypothetical protein FA15DRAFT_546077, partial [Coprinopsis marcescibilis]